MQISLNTQDDVYPKNDDSTYFQQALEDIESGKDELIENEEYEEDMENFIKSL